jgi:hypothetical protein
MTAWKYNLFEASGGHYLVILHSKTTVFKSSANLYPPYFHSEIKLFPGKLFFNNTYEIITI